MNVFGFLKKLYNAEHPLEHNIWKFGVHLATNKRTYMTFMTIFLLTMPNSTAQTIGLLTFVGQIAGFLFEIPSGYISDRIGHKNAMVLARLSMLISTGLYIIADHKWYFFVATIFLALGWAFESGTSVAFMHETLSALGKKREYARIIGRIKSIGFAVPVLVILFLAVIADVSFRSAFAVAFVIDLIGLSAALLLTQPKRQFNTGELEPENILEVTRTFFGIGWLPYVFAGTLLSGIVLGATIGFKNPYQELLGLSITLIGVFWALSRVFIAFTLLINGWIHKHFTFKQFLLFEAGIVGLSLLGVGLTTNVWMVAGLFALAGAPMWGFATAREQYYLSFLNDKHSKATMLSINKLIEQLIIGVFGLIMGFLVIDVAYQNAYLVVSAAILLLITGIALFVPTYKHVRHTNY